jgi:hypothetical protein
MAIKANILSNAPPTKICRPLPSITDTGPIFCNDFIELNNRIQNPGQFLVQLPVLCGRGIVALAVPEKIVYS